MKNLQELMHADIQTLNEVIRCDLNSNISLINQITTYIITAGGKRIRPMVTLLCGRIAGFKDGTMLHQVAAMIEYIHTATLLHDDVVDGSHLRRGFKTVNATFGNAASVLVGDFIYSRAFQMMTKSKSFELLKLMADSTNQISEGEVLQLINIGKYNLTENEYFAVIKLKTATLFASGASSAAIITDCPEDQHMQLVSYATNLGTAFQITDDILDYASTSQDIGKNIGQDLLEGKITLPLIYLIQSGTQMEQQLIQDIFTLNHSNHANFENDHQAKVSTIVEAVKNSDAIKYCHKVAQEFVSKAIAALEIFPNSEYKNAMLELAKSVLCRIK
jgi:octaprenyl-diphosphate synthase